MGAAEFAEACKIAPIACVQNLYNLSGRDDDPLIDACAEAGIAYVPFFPVGGFQPVTAKHLDAIAARHRATVPQVALAWLLARSPNILLIPGTGSLDHGAGTGRTLPDAGRGMGPGRGGVAGGRATVSGRGGVAAGSRAGLRGR